MDQSPVLLSRDPPIAILTLNRPDRLNAFNLPLLRALADALREVALDPELRAVILTGAGRAFSAGVDLREHGDMPAEARRPFVRAAQRANLLLQRFPRPVVAAVNGPAVGAGLELALSCDLMIAADDAKLRFPEVSLGAFVSGGVTRTLPRRVGMARAREILYFGEIITGEQACGIGLANRSCPATQVLGTSQTMARRLAQLAPIPLRHLRRILRRAGGMSDVAALRAEARALEACMATEDWAEGVRAFDEKRQPDFRGR